MDEPIRTVRRLPLVTAGALVAFAVVLPLLAPGFTLIYDMVFVPHPHLSGALVGLSPAYPRTVPTQLLVTLVSQVVPGAAVQKTILLAIFALAVVGVGRLVGVGGVAGAGDRPNAFAAAAAAIGGGLLYAWNPMSYERLRLGQWALLLGVAVLPWAVHAAVGYRRAGPSSGWVLTLWLAALVATGPYMATIGAATAIAVALWPTRGRIAEAGDAPRPALPGHARSVGPERPGRRAALLVAGAVAVNLVWFVPAALHPATPEPAAGSVEVFEARSDSPLGTVGSVLALGGVWRSDLAPPGRSTIAWIPAAALIAVVAGLGWRRMGGAPGWGDGARTALLFAAVAGLVLALAPAVPVAREAVAWAVRTVPGGGVLRDSQKFAIPFALLVAVAFGYGIVDVLGRVAGRGGVRSVAIVLVVLPIALAPTLAWGAGGKLGTASYPASWATVERITAGDPVPGGILVLPWHAYVPFPWNRNRPVHQPAILFFSRPALQSSALELGSVTLPAEDPWARAATPAVEGPEPLAPALPALGVRYVLAFKVGDWRSLGPKTRGLQTVLDAPDLVLYRARPPGPIPAYPEPPVAAVLAGDVVAFAWLSLAAVMAARGRLRRGRPRRDGGRAAADGPSVSGGPERLG